MGTVGSLYKEDLENPLYADYPMNATVGKEGVELAFEQYLHGTDGTRIVSTNSEGKVTGVFYEKEPQPGNTVELTIDLDLQKVVEEALEEADFVLEAIRDCNITGPVVFDWEVIGKKEARTYGLDTDTLCAAANAFCSRIREAGYQPMIYFNAYAGYVKYDLSRVLDYPFWFAQYKAQPDFYYDFQLWQYTSSGKVDGIQGNVDMDVWLLPNN